MSDAELARQMTQLTDAQLVEAQSADEYAFRHALTHEAVYGTLLVRERRRYHEAIAEALEQSYAPALDAHIPALAYHYYEAGAWAKALDYAQRAGAKAQAMFAPREAIQNFSRAIEAAAHMGRPASAALHRARGQAYDTGGNFEHARVGRPNGRMAGALRPGLPMGIARLYAHGRLLAESAHAGAGDGRPSHPRT